MAVPKKKNSVSRKGLRRAGQHHKLYRKHPMTCSNCGVHVMPHAVCTGCGHYKGKVIVAIKAESTQATAE